MKKNVKRKESILSIREKKLAYSLILPTMILVLSIVIIPLLANFWISFKPISLGDLRPPKLILKESVRGNLSPANDFAKIQFKASEGLVLCNPPYGKKLGDENEPLLSLALDQILGRSHSSSKRNAGPAYELVGETDMNQPTFQKMYVTELPQIQK